MLISQVVAPTKSKHQKLTVERTVRISPLRNFSQNKIHGTYLPSGPIFWGPEGRYSTLVHTTHESHTNAAIHGLAATGRAEPLRTPQETLKADKEEWAVRDGTSPRARRFPKIKHQSIRKRFPR